MEWVETTGRNLEEAKEAALDQLGVDETDAEFEVLEEPKAGLFGRVRGEARVRARVRPAPQRSKDDRRDRRRRSRNGDGSARSDSAASTGTAGPADDTDEGISAGASGSGNSGSSGAAPGEQAPTGTARSATKRRRGRSRPGTDERDVARGSNGPPAPQDQDGGGSRDRASRPNPQNGEDVEVALEEQGRIAESFLSGLMDEFGLTAEITISERDEDNVELALSGRDLGLLIGQKGSTLLAVQDLTRTVVQHKTGATNGRIHVDVGGYRQKRSEALAKFATEVANKVRESGERTALEPMSAADRKVVHDTITGIDGVSTISEGEDPRRRVVIIPSAS